MLALSENGELNWMYIGDEKEMFSFRQYDKYILLGGRAHRIGEKQAGGRYNALKESAKTMFLNNPGAVSLLSGLRKPQIRF